MFFEICPLGPTCPLDPLGPTCPLISEGAVNVQHFPTRKRGRFMLKTGKEVAFAPCANSAISALVRIFGQRLGEANQMLEMTIRMLLLLVVADCHLHPISWRRTVLLLAPRRFQGDQDTRNKK